MTFIKPAAYELTSQQREHSTAVQAALHEHQLEINSMVSESLQHQGSRQIDFATDDPETNGLNISEPDSVQPYIQTQRTQHNIGFLYGGYNTERVTYHSDLFDPETEPRNIHLAFDVWLDPETPIFSPLPATVFGSYAIVLEQ